MTARVIAPGLKWMKGGLEMQRKVKQGHDPSLLGAMCFFFAADFTTCEGFGRAELIVSCSVC